MTAQRVALGTARMIEILGWIAGHAEARHDLARGAVGRHGVGDNLAEANAAEPVIDRGARRLQRIALPPMGRRQSPGRLDRRREWQRPADVVERDYADE